MLKLEKALVIIDKPKHSQIALQRALGLQKKFACQLHLVSFCWHPSYENRDAFETHQRLTMKKEIMRQRRDWLRGQVLDSDASFGDISQEVVWTKDIAKWIDQDHKSAKWDLVVKSIHRSKTLTHTPLDWTLLRQCAIPLLLCCEVELARRRRVLAALDVSRNDKNHRRLNEKVLQAATTFAEMYNAQLHCVYALQVSEIWRDLEFVDIDNHTNKLRQQALEKIEPLVEPYAIATTRIHTPVDKVGKGVSRIASKIKAQLLVLGTTARVGLPGRVIGNSAEKVLLKAHTDIFALKP